MESDNLLLVALKQLGLVPKDLNSVNQFKNNDFLNVVLKTSNKVIVSKGIENFQLPESLSSDSNSKFKECRKIVEFLKSLGFKYQININNLLYPTVKEINSILEFLVELISKEDHQTDTTEFNEKSLYKIKQQKILKDFISKQWVMPELDKNSMTFNSNGFSKKIISNNSVKSKIVILDKQLLKQFKKNVSGIEVNKEIKNLSQQKTNELYENGKHCNLISNEDFEVSNEILKSRKNNEYDKLSELKVLSKNLEKLSEEQKVSESQQWQYLLNQRNRFIAVKNANFFENNFINKTILKRDRCIVQEEMSNDDSREKGLDYFKRKISDNANSDNKSNNKKDESKENEVKKSKLPQIKDKFENERNEISKEIETLSLELSEASKNLEILRNRNINTIEKLGLENLNLHDMKEKNEDLIKFINSKLDTLENLKKMEKNQVAIDDLNDEVSNLEKKYNEMVSNWNLYSNQMNIQISDIKEDLEVKKKEYSYKYDKIIELKKEIEEMDQKTNLKRELKNFLKEEFEKIPVEINRNKYINKISELTVTLNKEKEKWFKYLEEIKQIEDQLEKIVEVIKRLDNEIEDKMFQDAKSNTSLKDNYSLYIKVRENYNLIQKNMLDTQRIKDTIRETENKVDDYRIKLKNYDMNQLLDQVEFLKKEQLNS